MNAVYRVNQHSGDLENTSRRPRSGSITSYMPAGQALYANEASNAEDELDTRRTTDIAKLEKAILLHPNLLPHFTVVCTYLKLDTYFLEAISLLRQEGLWSDSMAHVHDQTIARPSEDQVRYLASVQATLFNSPPSQLFNLICEYRWYTNFQPTNIIDRLTALKNGQSYTRQHKAEIGSTAPDGQMYGCPSEKCRKVFKKGGHARNHVGQWHPEYLQLFPDYSPQQFTIEAVRPVPTSPRSERRSSQNLKEACPENQRHKSLQKPYAMRPDGLSVAFPNDETADYSSLVSPRSYGLTDTEESLPSPRQTKTPHRIDNAIRHAPAQRVKAVSNSAQHERGRDSLSLTQPAPGAYNTNHNPPERSQRRHSEGLSVQQPWLQAWV